MSRKNKTWTTSFNPETGEVNPVETTYPESYNKLYAQIAGLDFALDEAIDEKQKYKDAYNLMCDETWDLIPDEEKARIGKKLEELGL